MRHKTYKMRAQQLGEKASSPSTSARASLPGNVTANSAQTRWEHQQLLSCPCKQCPWLQAVSKTAKTLSCSGPALVLMWGRQ